MTAIATLRLLPPQPAVEVTDERTWCFECYERREAWVIRVLGEHGVTFREVMLEEDAVCRSCTAVIGCGTLAVLVRYPLKRAATVAARREP